MQSKNSKKDVDMKEEEKRNENLKITGAFIGGSNNNQILRQEPMSMN